MRETLQEQAHKAVDFLVHSAPALGKAKAQVVKAEAMLKVTKALAMKASGQNTVSAQEREAYASDQYLQAIERLFDATQAHEELRATRDAAQARISEWQTMSANQRGAEKGMGA